MLDFHKEIVRAATGAQSKQDGAEKLRRGLVHCMRNGDRFVINVDKLLPNFNTDWNFEPNLWPAKEIFNYLKWRSDETYMKIVKTSENEDLN